MTDPEFMNFHVDCYEELNNKAVVFTPTLLEGIKIEGCDSLSIIM